MTPKATKGAAEKDYQELFDTVERRHKELMDKWGKDARKICEMYTGDRNLDFNILFSNTETIVPAVFSRKPIPRVIRRYDEQRADAPAKITERMLTFLMDTNLPEYPDFMTAVEDSVLDAALPGQGLFRVRLVNKIAVLDLVEWDKFSWGQCNRWELCPWQAFAHDLTPDEILALFKEDMSAAQKKSFETKAKERDQDAEQKPDGEKKPLTIRVWETWVKKDPLPLRLRRRILSGHRGRPAEAPELLPHASQAADLPPLNHLHPAEAALPAVPDPGRGAQRGHPTPAEGDQGPEGAWRLRLRHRRHPASVR
jgi:hypothetical protein